MSRAFKVLLVEDSQVDQFTAKAALESYNDAIEVTIANDGAEAIQFMGNGYEPDFILLDLNMPRMSGRDFLEYYAEHASFYRPVFIISASDEDKEILEKYSFVKKHFSKPLDEYALDALRY